MSGEHWMNVTTIDDQWEVEMDAYRDPSSRRAWRHRPISFSGITTDWIPGRPPSGPYAKKD
ncbi:hypothetical protein [Bradyrhizobium elkanii]